MRSSLRFQLFINSFVILALGMAVAAILFWQSAENLYLETQSENLQAQASFTAALLQGQPLPENPVEPYSQVANVMPGTHTRVLSEQGAVVIGLPAAEGTPLLVPPAEGGTPVSPQDLLKRPEIISARNGVSSTAIRFIPDGNRRVLYAAAPVYDNSGSVAGLVYLAEPLPAGGLPATFFPGLAGAVLLAVLLALAAGTFFSEKITKPIISLKAGAEDVSQGDLEVRVPESSGIAEFDSLGLSFNRMVTSLRQSEQAQNTFVADVAHELRTPLTVIKGTVETLEDGAVDDLQGRGPLLASMQRETDRLIRLVNNLLVLTRADSGLLRLEQSPVDLVDLVRRRCDLLHRIADNRGITFSIHPPHPVTVLGDEDRLAQVLDNLLENASRYCQENGTIGITISSESNGIRCAVHNPGSYIPPDHLPLIFERFHRVEASRQKMGGEAGLGLSIVRALIKAHGGQVFARSSHAEGTTIGFFLPFAPDLNPY